MPKVVTKQEFDSACAAVWTEIEYQNNLPRRTNSEAKEPAGFATINAPRETTFGNFTGKAAIPERIRLYLERLEATSLRPETGKESDCDWPVQWIVPCPLCHRSMAYNFFKEGYAWRCGNKHCRLFSEALRPETGVKE